MKKVNYQIGIPGLGETRGFCVVTETEYYVADSIFDILTNQSVLWCAYTVDEDSDYEKRAC